MDYLDEDLNNGLYQSLMHFCIIYLQYFADFFDFKFALLKMFLDFNFFAELYENLKQEDFSLKLGLLEYFYLVIL
jgi:hypothetical protein